MSARKDQDVPTKSAGIITSFTGANARVTMFQKPVDDSSCERILAEGMWCLRAYQSFDGLCPLVCPPHVPQVQRGFECRWEECEDQPVYDDPELIVPDGFDPSDIHLDNVHRTKIGGYASNIQSEPWWGYRPHPANPRYCLQVDSEEKVGLIWGDSGTIYIARGTASGYEDQWFLDWQCY